MITTTEQAAHGECNKHMIMTSYVILDQIYKKNFEIYIM